MAASESTTIEVDGRTLKLTNLDKVLYPEAGFTKGEVIEYYRAIAPVMLPHIAGRGITLRRFPNGVDGESFFEKRCAKHRPDWLATIVGPGERAGQINYCSLDEPASLVWAANLAGLEIHAPMARGVDIEMPTLLVFDLDPGFPAGMRECCIVALEIREVLGSVGLQAWPKTSGSKGLQLYAPLNSPVTHTTTAQFAKALGQLLEKRRPELVVHKMLKELRVGKVLVDWSQNNRSKTTIAVYSMRAKAQPTVSTPVDWNEVESAANGAPLSFTTADVLARVRERGDLFAPTATLVQHLPTPAG
jgi:bifunctional non-homologous end joining protein LigD